LLVLSCLLRSHHKTNRAKENGGKCPREHFVQKNIQNVPAQFAAMTYLARPPAALSKTRKLH